MSDAHGALAHVLIGRDALAATIARLGSALAAAFERAPEPPLLVGVLKGSSLFLADLVRAMPIDVCVDFMAISSYRDQRAPSGVVRIVKDLDLSVTDRDVVIVEDIVDTGLTLTYLRRTLTERAPRSLRTVALLDKTARRIVPVPVEHVGFEIPDVFVIGYGLDFQGLYRNAPDIHAVADLARLINEPTLLAREMFLRRA